MQSGLPLPEWWSCRFGVSHVAYLPVVPPTYLTPFALWPAFPSADYYEVSVAMGPPLTRL